jgi:hypothetical protein
MVERGIRILTPAVRSTGILTSTQPLPRQWALRASLDMPGQKPAQARFASTKNDRHAR